MSDLVATCTPNSYPHPGGRVEHGYQLNVLDSALNIVATVDLPDWQTFDAVAATSRLSDAGVALADGVNGWSPAGLGYTVPVVTMTTMRPGS
ncbi:hypothetical protein AB0F30_33425 [Streptomyces sp. NPDC029006]|uniref:hypothetical protein n=1 Tax=Streptomyces sp. NPDC029006 TaxID=3155467 RepID=UPI003401FA30